MQWTRARSCRLTRLMIATFGAVMIARPMPAQNSERVDEQILVYHGLGSASGVVRLEDGLRVTTPDAGRVYLPVGSRLCFDVQNALSARYTYDVKNVVDTTPPKLPDFSQLLAVLQPMLPTTTSKVIAPKAIGGQTFLMLETTPAKIVAKEWHASYLDSLRPIIKGIDSATKLVLAADTPEDLADIGLAARTRSAGLGAVQRELLALPNGGGRIWSPRLPDDLESWYKHYGSQIPDDQKPLLEMLHGLGKQLLDASKTLRTNYLDATSVSRTCDTVRVGVNTLTLIASARDTTRANARTLKNIAHITAESPFDRKAVTLSPMAMFAMVDDVPHFILGSDSTVRRDPQHESITRIGTAIHLNAWQFREDHSWVVGPMLGIGFGTGNDKKLLADLMVGGTLGYRDAIRLGFGFGQTRVPDYIKSPAAEGARLPAGTLLNDVVGTNMRQTKYIVLTLNGLNFDIPGMTGK